MADLTHEENVRRSIEQARANAAANRPKAAVGGDRATQTVREELALRKYESEEAKARGEPPFETKITTVETVRDTATGEVLSQRVIGPDAAIMETPNLPLNL